MPVLLVQTAGCTLKPIATIMDKVFGHLCIFGVFFNSHRSNPSPYPTKNVGGLCPEFQLCLGWVRENCKKILKRMLCFKRELRNDRKKMNIVVLSQGILSRIVGALFSGPC